MQLTPCYGPEPVIVLDGRPSAIAAPAIRQRRRLVEVLSRFDDAQWSHPSRCQGWTNRDVVLHLDTTNTFWTYSIGEGRRGEPTRFLATFDPVASPAELVAGAGDVAPAQLLERFAASTDALIAEVTSLDENEWTVPAEAPPGHVSISALMHHALWDSWIHERDIVLPLGLDAPVEPDEVLAGLRYAAALGPAFAISRGCEQQGRIVLRTTSPDATITLDLGTRVQVGDGGTGDTGDNGGADQLELTGDAIALLEAFSTRAPFDHVVSPEHLWMLGGLHETFDLPRLR